MIGWNPEAGASAPDANRHATQTGGVDDKGDKPGPDDRGGAQGVGSVIRTKGSLCSGTGMLDTALPGELSWLAETDETASLLLKREHPDTPNLGDITAPGFTPWHVDLLTSGDPCQSLSVAGRKKASEDERFLWPYVMDTISYVRPSVVFLENVQNITSVPLVTGGERGGVLRLRLDNLREAGYAVRWTVLGACAIGAPHHRHRWFLRAEYVGSGAPEAERVIVKCGAPRNGGRFLLPSPKASEGEGGGGTSPKRKGGMDLRTAVQLLPTPTTRDGKGVDMPGRQGGQGLPTAIMRENWGKFAEAVAPWEQIIGRPAPCPTEPAPKGGRRLNPALSEWMMGMPEGHVTDGASRNDALKLAGNGVVALQARAAWEMLAPTQLSARHEACKPNEYVRILRS